MSLFNNKKFSDLTVIIKDYENNSNQKIIYCHRAILCNNGAEYFTTLYNQNNNFSDSQDKHEITTPDINSDLIILEGIYLKLIPDIDNYTIEEKITLFLRSHFYQCKELTEYITMNIFNCIEPQDIPILFENEIFIESNKVLIIKYLRLFFINIHKYMIDVQKELDEINEKYHDIICSFLLESIDKPIFGMNAIHVNNFYKHFNIDLTNKDYRIINENEKKRFKSIRNINSYIVFYLNHYILYRLMERYNCKQYMYKLDFNKMTDDQLSEICKESNQANIIKLINDIILERLKNKNNKKIKNNNGNIADKISDDLFAKFFGNHGGF